jgi:hypothetical protein
MTTETNHLARSVAIAGAGSGLGKDGRPADFTSPDCFRIENGIAAEHSDTVDYVRLYQSFGLLPETNDV